MIIELDKDYVQQMPKQSASVCPKCYSITMLANFNDTLCEIKIDYFDRDSSLIRIYYDSMLKAICHSVDNSYDVNVMYDEIKEKNLLVHCLEVAKNYIMSDK